MFPTGLHHLIKVIGDGGLDQLGAMGLVGFMQDVERARNLLSVVDHHARGGLPGRGRGGVCAYHHHNFHHHNFVARGWTGKINGDGIPEWTPPIWVDRDQKPMINTRIHAVLTARKQTHPNDRSAADVDDPGTLSLS